MSRYVRIDPIPPRPAPNGLYLDRSFGRRRRTLRTRVEDLAVSAAVLLVIAVSLAFLGLALVALIWVLLAIGRAVGAP